MLLLVKEGFPRELERRRREKEEVERIFFRFLQKTRDKQKHKSVVSIKLPEVNVVGGGGLVQEALVPAVVDVAGLLGHINLLLDPLGDLFLVDGAVLLAGGNRGVSHLMIWRLPKQVVVNPRVLALVCGGSLHAVVGDAIVSVGQVEMVPLLGADDVGGLKPRAVTLVQSNPLLLGRGAFVFAHFCFSFLLLNDGHS